MEGKNKRLAKCICGGSLVETIIEKEKIKMRGQKCKKCGEIYLSGSEMLRYDILTGRSKLVRKVRKTGDSLAITLPKQIVEKFGVHEDDMIYFKSKEKEIELEIIHSHQ